MDLRALFQTSKRAETEGKKLFLNAEKTVWLLVARKGNANYKARLTKLLQENQTVLNAKGEEAEKIATACFKEAAAHGVLIGWSPTGIDLGEVKDAQGNIVKPARKDIPYSVENALELFEMDDFYQMVDTFASDMSQYRSEEVAKDAKNLQPS